MCLPDKLKEAIYIKVRAMYKKGDPQLVNYRPMTIPSAMSKIFERITSEKISQFMAGMLSPLHSGFRQGYGTQHALFGVVER